MEKKLSYADFEQVKIGQKFALYDGYTNYTGILVTVQKKGKKLKYMCLVDELHMILPCKAKTKTSLCEKIVRNGFEPLSLEERN